ncbi:hypothetical protein GJ744_001782 [Endocarpon pusillum]|uniref:DFDF domain-containing protein n=1 Tax=Endocarpon pusillum TaxID=364733 RepID=A0A8H7A9L6_9EURO|nr:hypothetical protein GJ744_001782 [Endocarpon pusillum]
MDMDHLIGQRFNLISKSEIRYVGTLHEINPEQSTIALEDVYSFGTEGRPAKDYIPASNQKFDYIVFRGTDVKDIKVAEDQKENKQPDPNPPNDPAILNASRPSQPSPQGPQRRDQPPFPPPPNFTQHPQHQQQQPPPFQNYYPQYDRGYGPPAGGFPPGPGFQAMPYGPPPPGYYGPPGQSFINHGPFPPPPQMPIAPPGQRPPGDSQQQHQPGIQAPNELPVNDRAHETPAGRSITPISTVSPAPGPTPPNESKPTLAEALAPVPSAPAPVAAPNDTIASALKTPPTGPKSSRIVPAVPMTVNSKASAPILPATTNGPLSTLSGNTAQPPAPKTTAPTQIAMEEANRQARAAVATAMAKMNTNVQPITAQPRPVAGGNAVDALTKKVGEMKTSDGPRGGGRGAARGQRGNFRAGANQGRKMEIPKSDYDFESANAKFNKEDTMKEAIASGSPIAGPSEDGMINGSADSTANGQKRKDSLPMAATEAYNKSSSFFDNISSEAKDREEGAGQNTGRGFRGEEIKKNLETFGQGSVDGGFRGRGRGGFRGRGRSYGGHRGYGNYGRGGGHRGRGRGGSESAQA